MSHAGADTIVFNDVSKFYGEVLGVNRVHLELPSGITGLVGPNGSGKTTLMNLITGLLKPTEGTIRILDLPPDRPDLLFSEIGYCTQYDSFPSGMTGYQFVYSFLRVHGYRHGEAEQLTWQALERVNMVEAAGRKLAGYSKGMRQRMRVAQAISHNPRVLVLDEPLNGLDPMARAEVTGVFEQFAHDDGGHVIISSHILHEVDMFSDQVVFLSGGYVVAEGPVDNVRTDMKEDKPLQVLVRCDKPETVARELFAHDAVMEVTINDDRGGLLVRTRDAERFYLLLNEVVLAENVAVETVSVADASVRAIYQYLIGNEREAR